VTIKTYATARPRRGVGESYGDHTVGTYTGPPTCLGATTVFVATLGLIRGDELASKHSSKMRRRTSDATE